jgi:hypothetical protein
MALHNNFSLCQGLLQKPQQCVLAAPIYIDESFEILGFAF